MNKILLFILSSMVWAVITAGCTGRFLPGTNTPETVQDNHLAIVRVGPRDTLESLAKTYLGDSDKAWQIAAYNQVQTAEAGRRLVIPLKPVVYGGMHVDGYQAVPILLYAKIAAGKKVSYGISADLFEGQIQFLRQSGYRTVTLDALHGFFNLEEQLPPKAIVITFDSARRWVYEIAYPILKRYGFRAAVFVPTGRIGKPGYMGWQDLAAMAADGFDVGASGVSTRNLITLAKDDDPAVYLQNLEEEIAKPRLAIVAGLKQPCRYFAYPAGQTNDLIISMLKKNGYKAAFTRRSGSNPFFTSNYNVRRFVIANQVDAARFRQNLTTFVAAELR